MKKQLTTALLIFVLLLTMTGCSAANAVRRLDAAEDLVEAKLDAAEEKVEDSLRKAVIPDKPAAPVKPVPTEALPEPTSPAPENPGMLTEDQALQVALDHLGLSARQVTRLHTRREIDDGIHQFEVEFHQGDWEYEFEIHAEHGQILSWDKDHRCD